MDTKGNSIVGAQWQAAGGENPSTDVESLIEDVELEFSNSDDWSIAYGKVSIEMGREYGMAVEQLAQRWGKLMQVGMANGETFSDIVETTKQAADTEAASGMSMGLATQILIAGWGHGQELDNYYAGVVRENKREVNLEL